MPNKYNIQAQRQELDRLIRERSWVQLRLLFTKLSSTHDMRHCVESRRHATHRTLLHRICDLETKQPPADIVGLVASSCPRALFTPDSYQRLPIHLAIRRESGIDTVKVLLDSIPDDSIQYSKQSMLIHLDSNGCTPLMLAAQMNGSNREEIVKYLVNADDSGHSLLATKKNKSQNKAISPLKLIAAREKLFVNDGLDALEDLLRFMIISTYRSKMKEMMVDTYNIDNLDNAIYGENQVCLLQATIICHDMFGSTKLASSLLSEIIRNGFYQPNYKDCLGNSTLHIACLSSTTNFHQVLKLGHRGTSYGINSEDCTLIEHVIRSNRNTFTSFLSRNDAGDIPLHCAIRAGKEMLHIQQLLGALEQSAMVRTQKGELPIHLALKMGSSYEVIMLLWRTYADAALVMDKSTGLYLFQLTAAVGTKYHRKGASSTSSPMRRNKKQAAGHNKRDDQEKELEDVSLSYFFLRERPEVISFFHY